MYSLCVAKENADSYSGGEMHAKRLHAIESLPREVGCKVKGCMRDGLWARESKFAWDMSLEGSGALKLV